MIELSRERLIELKESSSCYILGVLAQKKIDKCPLVGQDNEPVTITKKGDHAMFFVRAITSQPEAMERFDQDLLMNNYSDLYTVVVSSRIYDKFSLDFKYKSTPYDKAVFLEEFLKDKLILFKPEINTNSENKAFKNLQIVRFENTTLALDPDLEFIQIPKIDMNYKEFEYKLMNKEPIELKDYPVNITEPEYLICDEYIYSNFDGESWDKTDLRNATGIWTYDEPQNIKKVTVKY